METEKNKHGVYPYCRKSTRYSIYSRQCFVTGELCSKQTNVHKEREKLHKYGEINAFVIMNFSDMSDVVYKWKLRSFIESLKKFLYLNNTIHEIACVAEGESNLPKLGENEGKWEPVQKVNVVRADSHTASNYIICNRVCQQMQIADLVIVDVSVENTNVFYEFGMAAAFGKLILPICYNESFYQMKVPEKAKEYLEDKMLEVFDRKYACFDKKGNRAKLSDSELEELNTRADDLRKMIENHIDCYPWRRKLFEFYGIRYRNGNSGVGYTNFKDIVDPSLGFSDVQYNRFPYVDTIEAEIKDEQGVHHVEIKVGELLYKRLSDSYNNTKDTEATKNTDKKIAGIDQKSYFNTVVIYTMDNIINEEQAGQCIINFYRNMTVQIRKEYCFCGDRVGIMGQANIIPDDPKDTKTGQKLLYRVGDVIRIGMNEATHVAQKQRIKTNDYLLGEREELSEKEEKQLHFGKEWRSEAIRFTKEHVRNRCVPIYPDEPIYVQMLREGIQKGILGEKLLQEKKDKNDFDYEHFFCLFHVTLHTLRYINEIVVDLSRNSLQALFWLGVAHGCNAQSITVRHAPTEDELKRSEEKNLPEERNIFDVAGLWTAILHSNDTDGFYRQLAMTQIGIEQHNKLTLPEAEMEYYREQLLDEFYEPSPYMKFGFEKSHDRLTLLKNGRLPRKEEQDALYVLCEDIHGLLGELYDNHRMNAIWKTLSERNRKESERLESYYRSLFWRRMLRYNELQLYTTQHTGDTDGEPRRVSITWDLDAMAELSHYLSKRTTIGRYRLRALQENTHDETARSGNYICIGGNTVPMQTQEGEGVPLVAHIRNNVDALEEQKGHNMVRHLGFCDRFCESAPERKFSDSDTEAAQDTKEVLSYRGFVSEDGKHNVYARFLKARCTGNMFVSEGKDKCETCARFLENSPERTSKLIPLYEEVKVNPDWEKTGKGTFETLHTPVAPCGLRKADDNIYDQLAQMILWREVPKEDEKQKERLKYWVSLIGVSGPSTLALSSLLVNDEQKRELFGDSGWPENQSMRLPLNDLQTQIRAELRDSYNEKVKEKLTEKKLDWLYPEVSYATGMYLSTVMYQYFFPFLSRADEKRICNGMEAFITTKGFRNMFAEAILQKKVSDEGWKNIEELILKVLEAVLSGLRGVEALYTVKVHYGQNNKDDRRPCDIRSLQKEGKAMVSCLFAKKE